jgi:aerobic-type carbon monoxide dehydrogenase small subunit (CoxS/CutS family)
MSEDEIFEEYNLVNKYICDDCRVDFVFSRYLVVKRENENIPREKIGCKLSSNMSECLNYKAYMREISIGKIIE